MLDKLNDKKAYLFDFDGTLVDSMPTWSVKVLRLLEMQGISVPEGLLQIITPLGDMGTINYYIENFPVTMSKEEMKKEMDKFALPKYANEIPVKEYVKEYLQKLKSEGKGIYLLTASPKIMFEPCLERLGLLSLFDKAWSCEDFSTVKSNPEIYSLAAKRIGLKVEEIAFFDDNIVALKTAKTADMFTVGVYDETSKKDTAEIKKVSDIYINSFKEIL